MNPLKRLDNQQELCDLQGKICVEVGVYRGDFAADLEKCLPERLFLVDCWEHQDTNYDDPANLTNEGQIDNYLYTEKRFASNKHVELIKAYSVEASFMFADEIIDLVYIDANHEERACHNDIVCWWPKIKVGGWICGHDYAWPSVQNALKRFNRPVVPLTRDSWGIQKV